MSVLVKQTVAQEKGFSLLGPQENTTTVNVRSRKTNRSSGKAFFIAWTSRKDYTIVRYGIKYIVVSNPTKLALS